MLTNHPIHKRICPGIDDAFGSYCHLLPPEGDPQQHSSVILSRSHVVTRAESRVGTQTTSGLRLEFVAKERTWRHNPRACLQARGRPTYLSGRGVRTHALRGLCNEQSVYKHLMKTVFPHPWEGHRAGSCIPAVHSRGDALLSLERNDIGTFSGKDKPLQRAPGK